MTLQQLRYAIAVADCGSMNQAAAKLFISQPSLSEAVKELEGEIGIRIFGRTNRGILVTTEGNDLAHVILRGGVDKYGTCIPNYHYEDLVRLLEAYKKKELKNPAAIIDANHSNSNKKFKEQIRIVSEVIHSRNYNPELKTLVKGVMIESYLEEGNQTVNGYMDALSQIRVSDG